MLIYRLVHFKDAIQDIETGLKRRNRELCKPILQLFYDCSNEIQIEIKSMFEHFLTIKKTSKREHHRISPLSNNNQSSFGIWIEICSKLTYGMQ